MKSLINDSRCVSVRNCVRSWGCLQEPGTVHVPMGLGMDGVERLKCAHKHNNVFKATTV